MSSRYIYTWLFIGILILAAFFRFLNITETPPGLYPDEAMNGNNAAELLETGEPKVFYTENNGREGLYIWLQAASVGLFGHEAWALRLVSASIGVLTVFVLYFLAFEIFPNSKYIALLSSFFLATSFWHIMFSRIGFRAILVPLISSLALYFLISGFRKGSEIRMALAGFFTALGFYTYISFRFMPFVLLIPIGYYIWRWLSNKQTNGCTPCMIGLFLFIALVVFIPLGLYFIENPGDILGRSGQVSVFSAENPLFEFAKSNVSTIAMLFVFGDCNMRHNFACLPALNPLVAIFFAIGLWSAIQRIRINPKDQMPFITILAWFVFMTLPATLTREGLPHALRSIGMIPPVMLLAALGAYYSWQFFENRFGRNITVITSLCAGLFIVASTHITYFTLWAHNAVTQSSFSSDVYAMSNEINGLPNTTKKLVVTELPWPDLRPVGTPAQTVMFRTHSFTQEARLAQNIEYVADWEIEKRIQKAFRTEEDFSLFLLRNPRNEELIRRLLLQYPQLTVIESGMFTIIE